MLPNRLKSGQVVLIRGRRYKVCMTSGRDEYGEPLYRLRGYQFGVKGKIRYTRDALQQEGAELEEE